MSVVRSDTNLHSIETKRHDQDRDSRSSARRLQFYAGVSQYSGGVGALPGFTLERVRFTKPMPLRVDLIASPQIIKAAGRPLTAFAACELRSPAPFTEDGFKEFNESYTSTLIEWGVMADGVNPVARSNVCPKFDPPSEPGFHALYVMSYRRRMRRRRSSSPAVARPRKGKANYRDHTVRLGDISPDGMLEKAKWVLGEMERRMSAFSGTGRRPPRVQLYTVHDIYPVHRKRTRHAVACCARVDLALQSSAGGRSGV